METFGIVVGVILSLVALWLSAVSLKKASKANRLAQTANKIASEVRDFDHDRREDEVADRKRAEEAERKRIKLNQRAELTATQESWQNVIQVVNAGRHDAQDIVMTIDPERVVVGGEDLSPGLIRSGNSYRVRISIETGVDVAIWSAEWTDGRDGRQSTGPHELVENTPVG